MKKAHAQGGKVYYRCPGCDSSHAVAVGPPYEEEKWWEWTGGEEAPTFSPSVLSRLSLWDPETEKYSVRRVCHHWVKGGRIHYLPDCTHGMAGKTVEIPEFSDTWRPAGGRG